ncbi:unnamed protein product, partial [Candidula unifasciata]
IPDWGKPTRLLSTDTGSLPAGPVLAGSSPSREDVGAEVVSSSAAGSQYSGGIGEWMA